MRAQETPPDDVAPNDQRCIVRVANLDPSTEEKDIHDLFGPYGRIEILEQSLDVETSLSARYGLLIVRKYVYLIF